MIAARAVLGVGGRRHRRRRRAKAEAVARWERQTQKKIEQIRDFFARKRASYVVMPPDARLKMVWPGEKSEAT